jgi:hypothetical protein
MQEHEVEPEAPSTPGEARKLLGEPRLRLGAAVALAVAAGLVAWAVIGSGNSGSSTSSTPSATPIAPVALSVKGLRTLAATVNQPIYWAGPKRGYMYELTRTQTGNVFIRYLPAGVKAGAQGGNYLVIATYPFGNALQALKNVANGGGIGTPGGGFALVDAKYPNSVHLAYPGVNYQVEVYDPSPARSKAVAVSGKVLPVR